MRCFLAVELSDGTKARLEAAQRELKSIGLQASYPKKEQFHITLCFFGELGEAELTRKVGLLAGFSFPSFDLTLKGVGFFPSDSFVRVVWAGTQSKELLELQRLASEKLGYRDGKQFAGHVTLARIKTPNAMEKLAGFKERHADEDFGVSRIDRIVFKQSRLSPSGPTYSGLCEVALR